MGSRVSHAEIMSDRISTDSKFNCMVGLFSICVSSNQLCTKLISRSTSCINLLTQRSKGVSRRVCRVSTTRRIAVRGVLSSWAKSEKERSRSCFISSTDWQFSKNTPTCPVGRGKLEARKNIDFTAVISLASSQAG